MKTKISILLLNVLFCFGCVLHSTAQQFHVGDIYTFSDGHKGIIFHMLPDGNSGWVVALNDASSGCVWGNMSDIPTLDNQTPNIDYQQLLNDTAGYAHTQAILSYQNYNNAYAAGNVDYSHSWYLPSAAQLRILYAQLPFISNSFVEAGGENLAYDWYWCSSEYSASNAWRIDFSSNINSGMFTNVSKSSSHRVRAVRNFKQEYSSDIQYLWNTGDSLSNIIATPTQTTTYSLTVTVNNFCSATVEHTILVLQNDTSEFYGTTDCSYIWDGETYYLSGDYQRTFTNRMGCDSIVTLHLTVVPPDTTHIMISACEHYDWNDSTYTNSCTFNQTLVNHKGCDSIVTTHLTILTPEHQSETITAYDSYVWNNETYVQSGVYFFSHENENGCNQVDTLHLTIYYTSTSDFYDTACVQYQWNDSVYTSSGEYTQVFQDIHGADSVVTLHLTVNIPQHQSETIIAYDSYEWYGDNYLQSGDYIYVYDDENGCDQVDTLHLTIYYTTQGDLYDTACVQYQWNDSVYTSSGDYTQVFQDEHGADSVMILHLTINNPHHLSDSIIAYDSYDWNGETYTVTGTYFYTHEDAYGCTQVDTLYLTVYYSSTDEFFDTACVQYHWNDSVYTSSGDYTQVFLDKYGADSVMTLHLTIYASVVEHIIDTICDLYEWNGIVYSQSGEYNQTFYNMNGCDSTVVLHLTLHNSIFSDEFISICENEIPYTYRDSVYNPIDSDISIIQYPLSTIYDCDSIITVHFTIIPTTYDTVNIAVVENDLPLFYNDSIYESEGSYIQYLTNASGCDSILTVNVTVYENVEDVTDSTICENDLPFTWNGVTFTEAGSHPVVLTAVTGADSVLLMVVTVIPTTYGTFDTTVIENALPLLINDSLYSAEGTYTQTLTNAQNCDSILAVNVFVHYNVTTEADSTICESQLPIEWNGVSFTTAGTQTAVLSAHTGADSTVVMYLTVIPTTYGTLDTTVIENALPLNINDSLYSAEGTYTQYLTNAQNCDSVLVVNILVHYNVTIEADSTICESQLPFEWNGVSFSSAGTQTAVLTAHTGADSTVVMHLTVIPTTYGIFDTTVIENALPLNINDSLYSAEGIHTQYLTNAQNCDSVLVVNVLVHYNVTIEADSTICESQLPFEWNGVSFSSAGTQTAVLTAHTGADSTVVMHLTVIPTTYGTLDTTVIENVLPLLIHDSLYSEEGTYTQHLINAQNCDSVLEVNVFVHHNLTTNAYDTVCESQLPIEWNGVPFVAAGTQNAVFTASTGADSTVVMHLTVIPTTYGTVNIAVVENAMPTTYNGYTLDSAGVYIQYLTNITGCDSVLTVNLRVLENVSASADTTICETELPLVWNGVTFTEASEQHVILTASNGADSVLLMIVTVTPTTYGTLDTTVIENTLPLLLHDSLYSAEGTYTQYLTNAQNCDSVLVVNVFVHYNETTEADSTICESQLPIEWNGVLFTSAGTQAAVLIAFTGADSTVVMHLTVIPTTYGTLDTAVIENALPLLINDSTCATEGTYTQYFTNAQSCDSILMVNVLVHYNVTTEADSTVCEPQLPIEWNGVSFTTAGTQTALLTASTGADSTVVMHLTVHYPSDSTLHLTIYERELPYALNADTYDSAGTYTQNLTNVAGCDSALTVVLAVIPTVYASADSTICSSDLPLIWNGVEFTAAGTQTATLQAANGTDSVVTMTLTVNAVTGTTLNAEVIQNNLPYTLNDSTYTASGTYYQHFTNAAGCDSTVTLNLTVYNNTTAQVYATVCENELPYTWGSHVFATAGTFTDTLLTTHGADSVVTYTLSVDEIAAAVPTVTHVTCYGGSNGAATATVTGGMPNFAYAWMNAEGASVSTSTSISNQPAGTYTFAVTDVIGCVATATVTLNTLNDALQPGTIAEDQVVCEGEQPLPFTGTAASGGDNGAYQWQVSANGTDWTPAPGTNNTQNYTYTNIPTAAFSLRRVWVSQSCGTEYSNTVNITLWPNTMDTVTAAVCQNEAFEGFGFDITTDQTSAPGDYTFEQHHATGHCDSVVVLILTVNPLFETEVEDVVCEGEGYSDNGFEVAPIETVGEQLITRTQTLQSVEGCDSVVSLRLRVIDTAVRIVSLTPDFCEDLSAELMVVTDMPNYVWSTGETAPSIMVTHSGSYYVTASQGECSNTAHFVIENCSGQLLLPNAITPSNHDGLNDYFSIPERNLRSINLFEIWIYNRWGELVYYSNDKNFHWNGEYREKIQYGTIYNYIIRYTNAAGKPEFVKGSVTVL